MDRLVPAHTWIGLRDYRDRSTSRLVAAEASMRWLDTLTISFLEDLMDEESRSTVNTILLRRRDIHSLAARALSGDDQAARFAAALQAVPLQDPVLMLLDFKSRSQINVREEHESYASRRADYLRLAYESWEQAAVRAVSDLRSAEMLELAHHINGPNETLRRRVFRNGLKYGATYVADSYAWKLAITGHATKALDLIGLIAIDGVVRA